MGRRCRKHPKSQHYYYSFFGFWGCEGCDREESERLARKLIEAFDKVFRK
jgi:hypothetical protein